MNKFIKFFSGRSGLVIVIIVLLASSVSCVIAFSAFLNTLIDYATGKADTDTEAVSETETVVVTADETETETDDETVSETETEYETNSGIVIITEPDEETTAQSETETELSDETETESQTDAETEEVTEAETDSTDILADEKDEDRVVIVIDPGHGFDDIGTSGEYIGDLTEKDINLAISKKVVEYLEQLLSDCPEAEIYMTHDTNEIPEDAEKNQYDQYLLSLEDRQKYINSLGIVDAVVSIHCDYYEGEEKYDGVRLYYSLKRNKDCGNLAASVSASVGVNVGPSPSGVAPQIQYTIPDDSYFMTQCTDYPAVLIECGFVSTEADAKNLISDEWQGKIAKGIAEGIVDFLSDEIK